MLTECCERTIDAQDRYCPRCGSECRVIGIVERMTNEGSIGTGMDRNGQENPLRLLLKVYPEARLVVPTLMEDLELCADRIDAERLCAGHAPASETPRPVETPQILRARMTDLFANQTGKLLPKGWVEVILAQPALAPSEDETTK